MYDNWLINTILQSTKNIVKTFSTHYRQWNNFTNKIRLFFKLIKKYLHSDFFSLLYRPERKLPNWRRWKSKESTGDMYVHIYRRTVYLCVCVRTPLMSYSVRMVTGLPGLFYLCFFKTVYDVNWGSSLHLHHFVPQYCQQSLYKTSSLSLSCKRSQEKTWSGQHTYVRLTQLWQPERLVQ